MSPKEQAKRLKQIQKALDLFPKVVAEKKRAYKARQKFLKETFGDVVKEVERLRKKRLKSAATAVAPGAAKTGVAKAIKKKTSTSPEK